MLMKADEQMLRSCVVNGRTNKQTGENSQIHRTSTKISRKCKVSLRACIKT